MLVFVFFLSSQAYSITSTARLMYPHCKEANDITNVYSIISGIGMLLCWLLLTDLIGRVASEVGLFLCALTYFIAFFASAISSLEQTLKDFAGMPFGALSLWEIALGTYPN